MKLNLKTIIKRKQKLFSKMSIVEKRIAIAKDVIERIKISQFLPEQGVFCEIDGDDISEYEGKTITGEPITEVCDIVNSKQYCSVCAKGGLFMSYVGYVDNLKIDDLTYGTRKASLNGNEMRSLSKIFSQKQLSLIETTFENSSYNWNVELSDEEREICRRFHDKYRHTSERLIKIMKNIIKNNGTFKP